MANESPLMDSLYGKLFLKYEGEAGEETGADNNMENGGGDDQAQAPGPMGGAGGGQLPPAAQPQVEPPNNDEGEDYPQQGLLGPEGDGEALERHSFKLSRSTRNRTANPRATEGAEGAPTLPNASLAISSSRLLMSAAAISSITEVPSSNTLQGAIHSEMRRVAHGARSPQQGGDFTGDKETNGFGVSCGNVVLSGVPVTVRGSGHDRLLNTAAACVPGSNVSGTRTTRAQQL